MAKAKRSAARALDWLVVEGAEVVAAWQGHVARQVIGPSARDDLRR